MANKGNASLTGTLVSPTGTYPWSMETNLLIAQTRSVADTLELVVQNISATTGAKVVLLNRPFNLIGTVAREMEVKGCPAALEPPPTASRAHPRVAALSRVCPPRVPRSRHPRQPQILAEGIEQHAL